MSQVTSQSNLGTITDVPTFMRMASALLQELTQKFNGQIEFGSNITAQKLTVQFLNANTSTAIRHTLNKTGVSYFMCNVPSNALVYQITTAKDTNDIIYLACTVSATIGLVLF